MDEASPATADALPRFRQPRPWLRWLAVLVAVAGWYVCLELLRLSADPQKTSPFLDAVCGARAAGADNDCASVLTARQAYIDLSADSRGVKLPVSALGMAYFAFLGAWFLLIGPPTHPARYWHLLLTLVVLAGAWVSVQYLRIMALELHRWCAGCLLAHGINGVMLLLTLGAYPWRRPAPPTWPHPSARLALATGTIGVLLLLVHVLYVYVMIAGSILQSREREYAAVLNDPQFVAWDYGRQPKVDLPLYPDELFAGDANAPHTLVTFSDFHCPACRKAHEILTEVAKKYASRVRVVFRYYPQDPECNADPRLRSGGHLGACLAARAAEASRLVGGRDAYLAMRRKLWDNHDRLPRPGSEKQHQDALATFAAWAAELGLDRAAFQAALELPAIEDRIAADIRQAQALDLHAMPVLYLDGKRVRGWSRMETWDGLLGEKGQ